MIQVNTISVSPSNIPLSYEIVSGHYQGKSDLYLIFNDKEVNNLVSLTCSTKDLLSVMMLFQHKLELDKLKLVNMGRKAPLIEDEKKAIDTIEKYLSKPMGSLEDLQQDLDTLSAAVAYSNKMVNDAIDDEKLKSLKAELYCS